MENNILKVVSVVITIAVISLLVLIGPANAYITGLTISNAEPVKGQSVVFTVSAEIEQGEVLDIQSFLLQIQGQQNLETIECLFLPSGALASECPGISIQKIQDTDYQFGYGFLPGFLKYEITFETDNVEEGRYNVKLYTNAGEQVFQSPTKQITILSDEVEIEKCSIRAEGGNSYYPINAFATNNKISFYIPDFNAARGQGSFTAQSKDRISYGFDITAAQVDDDTIKIQGYGKFTNTQRQKNEELSQITYNITSQKVSINSASFNAQNLNVIFRHGC